jgi:hypothetical protein
VMNQWLMFLLALTPFLRAPNLLAASPIDVPEIVEQPPAAGKRVKVIPKEYAGTDVYYSLYLPEGYRPGGRYPVVAAERATTSCSALLTYQFDATDDGLPVCRREL